MIIGILNVELFIYQSNSLKHKRMVLNSLKTRLRNQFNIAVAEDAQDKWQKAALTIVGINSDRRNMNSTLSEIINFISKFKQVDLISHEMEFV